MKKFILILVLLFSLTMSLHSQWIKQNWPVFESIYGVSFFDANTGLVAMKTYPDSRYMIFRSTNSGFNWIDSYRVRVIGFTQKIDSTTFYLFGLDYGPYGGNDKIYKTYNKGQSWDSLDFGLFAGISGFYFIGKDTGWVAKFTGSSMNIYKTENGGTTLNLLSSQPSGSEFPKMFFLKQKYNGNYIGFRSFNGAVKKTTDGGYNWIDLPGLPGANDTYLPNGKKLVNEIGQITFLNKDTGWVSNGTKNVYYTNNGGNNWIIQSLPFDVNFRFYGFGGINIINRDTIYADYGSYKFGNKYRGIIFKTTNAGQNWGYQLPDTSMNPIPVDGFYAPSFISGLTGWFTNIHTTNGGGPIIFTEIKNIIVEHPEEYKLMQNYPNPFNPSTTIDFYLPKSSVIYLRIYDIAGRLILKVIEGFQLTPGYHSYRIDGFSSLGLSSGVYFYKLTSSDKSGSTTFQETKKMIYSK